eukprot:TRINITY_DN4466_c0_g1_i3.p1 TRINITY_DN4466_c0_g1~~TRINITY_DN4466_c0_g1_i3.p1  ORF type:complete len:449 (-),score=150.41 TRINITY_DN4466_c0_g1_i3:122-1468(-)
MLVSSTGSLPRTFPVPAGVKSLSRSSTKGSAISLESVELISSPPKKPQRFTSLSPAVSAGSSRSGSSRSLVSRQWNGNILDRMALLAASRMDDPADVHVVLLSGYDIQWASEAELAEFTALKRLDVSANNIKVEQLCSLSALQELQASCNGIVHIAPLVRGFQELTVLNLSYNKLSPSAIASLSYMPKLARLLLGFNEIAALPKDMSSFRSLEFLDLERNNLKNDAVVPLSTIPNLIELNLSNNEIYKFPKTDGFACLEKLNISNNFFCTEPDVFNLRRLPALKQLLSWGNPVKKQAYEDLSRRVQIVHAPAPAAGKADVLWNSVKLRDKPKPPKPESASSLPPLPNAYNSDLDESDSDDEPEVPAPKPPRPKSDEDPGKFFSLTQVGELEETLEDEEASESSIYDILFTEDSDEEDEYMPSTDMRSLVHALRAALNRPSAAGTGGYP